tara:strand:+ start:648 stop:950 length:303 start_codon:yes stop_codon:yes gene_type:complete
MKTYSDNHPDSDGTFFSNLFKIEKIVAFLILGACGAYQLLRAFGLSPGLPGIYGLLPLLFLFCGGTLLLAGAGSEKSPYHAALLHVPLGIWLVIFVLALL